MDVRLNGGTSGDMRVTTENGAGRAAGIEGQVPVEQDSEPALVDIAALRTMAMQYRDSGAWFDAADAWALVVEHPDSRIEDFLALADSRERINDTLSAVDTLNRACVRFPDDPRGYLALGGLQERLGKPGEARFQYLVGLSYCPNDPLLTEGFSRCEKQLGLLPETPEINLEGLQAALESMSSGTAAAGGTAGQTSGAAGSQPEGTSERDRQDQGSGDSPTTLIGGTSTATSGNTGSAVGSTQVEETDEEGEEEEIYSGIEILDLRVVATEDSVSIEVATDGPAELVTSQASDPPRLVVRLPNARIADGAGVPSEVRLNTPLAERVNLIKTSADSNVVLLVVYLGQGTRFTVGSDARTVRVTITAAPGSAAGG
jgi:hypothetical protein